MHILNMGGQTINTGTAMGKLFISMAAAFAECEKNLIKERCDSGRKARRAEGRRIGEVPYGWNLADDGKTLIENPLEQQGIALAHAMHKEGFSLRSIAAELTERNIPAKRRGRWSHRQVASILFRKAA